MTEDSASSAPSIPKIDRDLTVDFVTDRIVEHFPTLSGDKSEILQKNKEYVESLTSSEDINDQLIRNTPQMCPMCNSSLLDWPYQSKKAYFISIGQLKEIKIPVRTCPDCKRAFYPHMHDKGLFNIHNKAIISVDFLYDFDSMLSSGSGLIESIQSRILLLGQREGIPIKDLKTNLSNLSKDIENMCCAVLAVMVTGVDLDAVTCLICGCCPKIINSGEIIL